MMSTVVDTWYLKDKIFFPKNVFRILITLQRAGYFLKNLMWKSNALFTPGSQEYIYGDFYSIQFYLQ